MTPSATRDLAKQASSPERRHAVRVAFALISSLVLLSACGGGSTSDRTTAGDKTFQGDGYSFTYPGGWVERDDLEAASGGGQGIDIGPAGRPSADNLFVGSGMLDIEVTEDNIDRYSEDLAAGIDDLFRQADGGLTSQLATRDTVAGLPALRLEASAVNVDGIETKSHLVLIYDGPTEYFLNCQYTPEGAQEMTAGCDQVIESFQVK